MRERSWLGMAVIVAFALGNMLGGHGWKQAADEWEKAYRVATERAEFTESLAGLDTDSSSTITSIGSDDEFLICDGPGIECGDHAVRKITFDEFMERIRLKPHELVSPEEACASVGEISVIDGMPVDEVTTPVDEAMCYWLRWRPEPTKLFSVQRPGFIDEHGEWHGFTGMLGIGQQTQYWFGVQWKLDRYRNAHWRSLADRCRPTPLPAGFGQELPEGCPKWINHVCEVDPTMICGVVF